MDRYDLDEDVVSQLNPLVSDESPLKQWRLKFQDGTLTRTDFTDFFKKSSRKYFAYHNEYETDSKKPILWGEDEVIANSLAYITFYSPSIPLNVYTKREYLNHQIHKLQVAKKIFKKGSLKCMFNEAGAKEAIIDLLVEFMMGENPVTALEKLRLEGNTTSVCGKVFRNGEPTYSCRECGMDPTCVLCVNCFKQSAHRFHKYKMSTSGGGGCCDCGDNEAWKKDQYCELHKANCQDPRESKVITDSVMKRAKIAFSSVLSFCVNYLEIEPNSSLQCLDGDGDGDGDEHFCTVLYNDESHTFDQVINTLTKIAKCRNKDAMEIVAAIDREGRAVVKCDTFKECNDLKIAIENQMITPTAALSGSRHNQSLRTSVLHIHSVACQQFALQLLSWFQEFLVRHYLFRNIFSDLVQDRKEPFCIRHILEYDVKLWKTARTCWHRLLISGLLMEYDNKMLLAQEFSRRYATIVEDFIHDDHDHSFSIVSLSVQLFTVPSIAHHLIAHEGIFYKLLHTFYYVSIEKFIQNNTLHFSKNIANMGFFKRAAYILYDLRYLLSLKPEVWTTELRSGFLDGCKALMRVLNVMQGMESTTRQTGQHMDYEPEWECAFNLHIKLATTISQVIEWAASDVEVLKKLYRMAMRALVNNTFIVGSQKIEDRSVAGHVAGCLIYDVTARPVSIHLPLSRFYAGVYLHLGTYGMNYDNMMSGSSSDATVTSLSPREIVEPVLCTQAMIAQVAAGMWRRNGYSLLHQLYFYRNVRCRTEMLDRDVVVLQIGASLMESNQFLIHMLNKFNLVQWMQPNYEGTVLENSADEDFMRQLTMADEFLELLIVIIGERYVPGVSNVTEKERNQKEIIQLLCIKAYSHSELSRALPDSSNDTSIEEVIESVATFKKPQKADTKGVYELKDELYDDFNLYFYHYTKEDKSKAEETQRERRKVKGELVCCPPPKLPKFADAFVPIANILQCDVFLSIINVVLDRAIEQKAKVFTENHLQKVLHLIGYAMQEEESNNYPFLSFYERAKKLSILNKLEDLARSRSIETNRDFILWIIKRWKEQKTKETFSDVSMQQSNDDEEPPLCAAEQAKREKEVRARLAAERRAKIMAQMQSAQKNFIQSNAEMFANTNAGNTNTSTGVADATKDASDENTKCDVKTSSSESTDQQMDWQVNAAVKQKENDQVIDEMEKGAVAACRILSCIGFDRHLQQPEEQKFKCILCFEDCVLGKGAPTLVCSAYVQTSRVLLTALTKNDGAAMHTSSCGHVMHYSCWQEYFNTEETKEQRRPHRNRVPYANGLTTEFQCPYCRCLSNAVLPLSEPLSKHSPPSVVHTGNQVFTMESWLDVMRTFSDELDKLREDPSEDSKHFYAFPCFETVLDKTTTTPSNVKKHKQLFERFAQIIGKPTLDESWNEVMNYYIKGLRTAALPQGEVPETEGLRLLWETCSYSIRSLEVYLRATNKPLTEEMSMRHKACASNLVRACCLYAANLTQNDVKNLVAPVSELMETVFKQRGDSVLEYDCFSMMVSTIFMVPNMLLATDLNRSIIANGSMMDYYAVKMFFLAQLTKAIITFSAPGTTDTEMDVDLNSEATMQYVQQLPESVKNNIIEYYKKFNMPARKCQYFELNRRHVEALRESTKLSDLDQMPEVEIVANDYTIVALFEHLRTEMSIFLRCTCIFFHFMTDVEFPENMDVAGSDNFEVMCEYLGLEHQLGKYFETDSLNFNQIEKFGTHQDILLFDFANGVKPNGNQLLMTPCVFPLPEIVILPDDYSELINSVSEFICPNNDREEMKTPTMCLICGVILCGQSYCCQPELGNHTVGACTHHAHQCGAEVGIFLRIRDCQVVYLGRGKGCFVQPPYLDEYGETDQGLRRGNPLRLCQSAYNKIYLHWLGHGLHEEIARLNDNANIAITQWHHM